MHSNTIPAHPSAQPRSNRRPGPRFGVLCSDFDSVTGSTLFHGSKLTAPAESESPPGANHHRITGGHAED